MQLHSSILAQAHALYPVLAHTHMNTLLISSKNSVNWANGIALIFLNILLMRWQCASIVY